MSSPANIKRRGPGFANVKDLASYATPAITVDASASWNTGRSFAGALEKEYFFTFDAAEGTGDDVTIEVPLTDGFEIDLVTQLTAYDDTVGLLPASDPSGPDYANVSVNKSTGVITIGATAGLTLGGGTGSIRFTEVESD